MEATEVPQHFRTHQISLCAPHQEGRRVGEPSRAAAGEQEPTVEGEEGLGPEGSENLSTGVTPSTRSQEMAVDVVMVGATTVVVEGVEHKVGSAAPAAAAESAALDAVEAAAMTAPAPSVEPVERGTASSGSSRKEPRWSIKWVSRSQRPLKRPRGFL